MAKAPTVKELKLAKAKAQGKKHIEAWDQAGYSQNSSNATKIANTQKILSKPNVQEALQKELHKQGITLEQAIAPISKALKATKVQIHGNGEEAFAEVVEDIDLQLKGSDRALKLMGVSGQSEGNNIQTNFVQIINQKADKYAD